MAALALSGRSCLDCGVSCESLLEELGVQGWGSNFAKSLDSEWYWSMHAISRDVVNEAAYDVA